jgi:hypothetical protein
MFLYEGMTDLQCFFLLLGIAIVLDVLFVWGRRYYQHNLRLGKLKELREKILKLWPKLKRFIPNGFLSKLWRSFIDHTGGGMTSDDTYNNAEVKVKDSKLIVLIREYGDSIDLILALLVMYAGQYLFINIPWSRKWGCLILMGGIVLILLRYHKADSCNIIWVDGLQILLGFIICLVLALDVKNLHGILDPPVLIILWGLSIVLVAEPALKLETNPIFPKWNLAESWKNWEIFFLIFLLVGAFFLRFISVKNIPGPIDPDEASLALYFLDVVEGRYSNPFGTGWATHPALQYFLAIPLAYLSNSRIILMRIYSVFLGTLAVGTLYLAVRVGWGRRMAILVSIVFMCSDVGIHFSRLGVNNISDSLFATWTIAALWTAASVGHPMAYIMTGIGMGLGQYFYFGNRAIPFVVIFTLFLWAILNWRKVWQARKPILFIFLVSIVVAGPLIGLWIRNPGTLDRVSKVASFFSKSRHYEAQQTGKSLTAVWLNQIRDSLYVFTVLPDQGSFYNPGRSMLPVILAPFFYFGLLVFFSRWKYPANIATLIWVGVYLTLGSMLINTAATFQRLLGMYPAVLLVMVIGLDIGLDAFLQKLNLKMFRENRMTYIVIGLIALGSIYYYFFVFNTQIVWKPPHQEAHAFVVREYEERQGKGTDILYTNIGTGENGEVYNSVIKFIAGKDFIGSPSHVDKNLDERPFRFYVFHDKFTGLSYLKANFPGGKVKEYHRQADDKLIMLRYTVP